MRITRRQLLAAVPWGWMMADVDLALIMADGEFLKREGSELVGAAAGEAPAGAMNVYATFDPSMPVAYPQHAWLVLEAGPDTTAPTVPTDLAATAGNTEVALTWTASTDNIGVAGYRIYIDTVLVDTSPYPSYTAIGLTNAVEYDFQVAAFDSAGNASALTAVVSATPSTPPPVLDTPPVISWYAAWWAEDAAWTHPAEGGTVDSWRDYTGGTRHLVQTDPSKRPAYTAARAVLNNKPALLFTLDALTVPVTLTAPYTYVVIGRITSANGWLVAGSDATHQSGIGTLGSSAGWRMSAGTELSGGLWDINIHLFRAYFNGATSVFAVDAATPVSGNVGTQLPASMRLMQNAAGTTQFNGDIVFAGIYAGDVTAHANWAAFVTWANRYRP